MRPINSASDIIHGAATYMKLLGYFPTVYARMEQLENSYRLFFRQLVSSVMFSTRSWVTMLPVHVSQIIGMGSNGEMLGVYTRTVITGMHHYFAGRYRPTQQYVRKAVSGESLSANFHSPVAVWAFTTCPFPASNVQTNVCPESCLINVSGCHGPTIHASSRFVKKYQVA